MPDLRNRIIRISDPGLQEYLGSVPNTSWMQGMGAMQRDPYEAMQDQFEDQIIQGLTQFDPDSQTYEIDVQDYLSGLPDPEVVNNSPKIQNAVRSLASRYNVHKQWKQQNMQNAIALAELGVDPREHPDLMAADGKSLDPIAVAKYKGMAQRGELGTLKKTRLSENAAGELARARMEATRLFTDEEKTNAFLAAKGREPKTNEDWIESDTILRAPLKMKYSGIVDGLGRAGYDVGAFEKDEILTPQGQGMVPTSQATQSATPTGTGDIAEQARQRAAAKRQAATAQGQAAASQEQKLADFARTQGKEAPITVSDVVTTMGSDIAGNFKEGLSLGSQGIRNIVGAGNRIATEATDAVLDAVNTDLNAPEDWRNYSPLAPNPRAGYIRTGM